MTKEDPYRGTSKRRLVELLRQESNPATLARFTQDSAWQVRHAAIEGLGRTGSPQAEQPLMRVLEASRDPSDLVYANAALSKVGSVGSIPKLARLIHHSNDDVKASAINALKELGDPTLTPLYLDALGDRSWVGKWYAMAALYRHGDERAIDAVIARVQAILSRDRKTNILGWSELMYAVGYLKRWEAADGRIAAFLQRVRDQRWARLSQQERDWWTGAAITPD